MSKRSEIKVRGYHLDLYGHVNNARYLEFLEEARWSFFEDRGDLEWFVSRGLGFSVVNININYRRPAKMGEVLAIASSVARIGNRSGTVHQEVRLQGSGAPVADADVTFAVVDARTGRAVPLEGELREVFERAMAGAGASA